MIFLVVLATLNVIAWGGLAIIFWELVQRAAQRTAATADPSVLLLASPAVLAILVVCVCWYVRRREPLFSVLWAISVFILIGMLFLFVPVLAVSGSGM